MDIYSKNDLLNSPKNYTIDYLSRLSYVSIVDLLYENITPYTRKYLLDRLYEINNKLIAENEHNIYNNPLSSMNVRKKTNILDSSYNRFANMIERENPLPLNNPINTKIYKHGNNEKYKEKDIIDDMVNDMVKNKEISDDAFDNKIDRINRLFDKINNKKKK